MKDVSKSRKEMFCLCKWTLVVIALIKSILQNNEINAKSVHYFLCIEKGQCGQSSLQTISMQKWKIHCVKQE